MKSAISVFMVLALCFSQVACTEASIINDIEIAAQAASVAVPIVLGSAGVAPEVVSYVAAANKALGCAASAASAGGTQASVAAAVVACLSSAAVPVLPAGTDQAVANAVAALASDIQSIVKQYTPSAAAKLSAAGAYKPSFSDRRHIRKIQSLVKKNAEQFAMKGVYGK
jgi:hypothetical protein